MSYDPSDAKSVFLRAAELTDSTERAAFLSHACNGNPDLRARVENLLKAASDPDSLIDAPLGEFAATQLDNRSESELLLNRLENENAPESPLQLGGYKVLEVIGRGGMGIVLRALDEKLNRIVAIKVLASDLARQPQARKRFLREAQAAAAVSHDHVVTIHAVDDGCGTSNNIPLLVMECIVGQSLQQKIDKVGALGVKEILRIGMQIASGLAAAHQQGLVHRDIKPSNILLENGVERVKITDFGLARATDDVGITVPGQIAGTPLYMSPEQAAGQPVDQRSDLFSLGSVLYTMCTGRPAFRADSAVAVLRRVCDDTPRDIEDVNTEIPDWLVAIVNRLMAKKKEDRFQSAREVATLLESWLAHTQQPDSVQRPVTAKSRSGKPARSASSSVLGHAWNEWWSQRDRWFTIGVQAALILAYLVCMVCFISFRLSTGVDSDGHATFAYRLGVPSPWFYFDVYPEPLVPFRSGFYPWSRSVLLGLLGSVFFYVYWRIQKTHSPGASRLGSPAVMIGIWIVGACAAIGFGQWMGYDALGKPRVAVKVSGPEPERVRTTSEEQVPLRRTLDLAKQDLEDVRRRFEAQTVPVTKVTEAEVRVTEAELRLAETQLDWHKVEQCFAMLAEQNKRLVEFARKQYEAGIVRESQVSQSEAALLEILRRWHASRKRPGIGDDATLPGIGLTENSGPETHDTLSVAESSQPKPAEPVLATTPFDAIQAQQHQEAWAQLRGVPVEISNSVGLELRLVPPGKFQMGSTAEELEKLREELERSNASNFDRFNAQSSGPRHVVEISRPFYMGQYEVTVDLFRQFLEESSYQPSAERTEDARFTWKDFVPESDASKQPVCGVSWEDATAFCEWLNSKTSSEAILQKYSLPTEAQWEFACRAGSESLWAFGDAVDTLNEYAIIGQKQTLLPATIGLRRANAFGLFDMHGNVDEWCLDWHSADFYGRSPLIDPVCSETPRDPGSRRVARGGAWNAEPWWSRSATRSYDFPSSPTFPKGFRVVGQLPQ